MIFGKGKDRRAQRRISNWRDPEDDNDREQVVPNIEPARAEDQDERWAYMAGDPRAPDPSARRPTAGPEE